MQLLVLILFALCFAILFQSAVPIRCIVGYGQTGLQYSNEITWSRNCPNTNYCWKAVTNDIKKMQNLIQYPWDPYYYQYFIRSCGGDYGMKTNFHPYKGKPKYYRNLGIVKVNITTPHVITGQGSTEQLDLMFTCRHDLCTKLHNSANSLKSSTAAITIIASVLAVTFIWM